MFGIFPLCIFCSLLVASFLSSPLFLFHCYLISCPIGIIDLFIVPCTTPSTNALRAWWSCCETLQPCLYVVPVLTSFAKNIPGSLGLRNWNLRLDLGLRHVGRMATRSCEATKATIYFDRVRSTVTMCTYNWAPTLFSGANPPVLYSLLDYLLATG